MSVIPIISSAADVPGAVRHAQRSKEARWYVARRAIALDVPELVPPEWGLTAGASKEKRERASTIQGTDSFPIENKADIRKAVRAYGRASNKEAAKKHILSQARKLGAMDLIPDDWKGTTASASGTRRLPRRQGAGKLRAMTAAGWDPDLHPRDRDGRFIEKLDLIDVFAMEGGTEVQFRGKAVGNGKDSTGQEYIEVEHDSGLGRQVTNVPTSRVKSAPPSKARLDSDKKSTSHPLGAKVSLPVSAKAVEREQERYDKNEKAALKMKDGPAKEKRLRDLEAHKRRLDKMKATLEAGKSTEEPEHPELEVAPDEGEGETDVTAIVEELRDASLPPEVTEDEIADEILKEWDVSRDDALRAVREFKSTQPSVEPEEVGATPGMSPSKAEKVAAEEDAAVGGEADVAASEAENYKAQVKAAIAAKGSDMNPEDAEVYFEEIEAARLEGKSPEETADQVVADDLADMVQAIIEDGDAGDYSPEEIDGLITQLQGVGRNDMAKALDSAADAAGVYDADNDDEDFDDEDGDPNDLASTEEVLSNREAVLKRLREDDEYEATLGDPDEDGPNEGYITVVPPLSRLKEQVADRYGNRANLPEDPDSDGGDLDYNQLLEDLDIVVDGDDDHAMEIVFGRLDKAISAMPEGEVAEDLAQPPLSPEDQADLDADVGGPTKEHIEGLGSGTMTMDDEGGTVLNQEALDLMMPIRDLLDVDSGAGSWASGMNSIQFERLRNSVDDWLEDPDSVGEWENERLQGVQNFAEENGIEDLTDVIDFRNQMSELGWSIEEQLRGVLDGEPLETFNDNALRYAAEKLRYSPLAYWQGAEDNGDMRLSDVASDLDFYTAGGFHTEPEPETPEAAPETGTPDQPNPADLDDAALLDLINDGDVDREAQEDYWESLMDEAGVRGFVVNESTGEFHAPDEIDESTGESMAEKFGDSTDEGMTVEEARSFLQGEIDESGGMIDMDVDDYAAELAGHITDDDDSDLARAVRRLNEASPEELGVEKPEPANLSGFAPGQSITMNEGPAPTYTKLEDGRWQRQGSPQIWQEDKLADLAAEKGFTSEPAPSEPEITPPAPTQPSAPEGGDPAAGEKLGLMSRSAEKASTPVGVDEATARINGILDDASQGRVEEAHKDLAKLMTELKLGGKQRKRYRELLDAYVGGGGDDSAQTQAAETAENLSDSNPVKEKLAAKAGVSGAMKTAQAKAEEILNEPLDFDSDGFERQYAENNMSEAQLRASIKRAAEDFPRLNAEADALRETNPIQAANKTVQARRIQAKAKMQQEVLEAKTATPDQGNVVNAPAPTSSPEVQKSAVKGPSGGPPPDYSGLDIYELHSQIQNAEHHLNSPKANEQLKAAARRELDGLQAELDKRNAGWKPKVLSPTRVQQLANQINNEELAGTGYDIQLLLDTRGIGPADVEEAERYEAETKSPYGASVTAKVPSGTEVDIPTDVARAVLGMPARPREETEVDRIEARLQKAKDDFFGKILTKDEAIKRQEVIRNLEIELRNAKSGKA